MGFVEILSFTLLRLKYRRVIPTGNSELAERGHIIKIGRNYNETIEKINSSNVCHSMFGLPAFFTSKGRG